MRNGCCKDCTERYVGCHSSCEKYISECEQREKEKQAIIEGEHKDRLLREYKYNSIQRFKKGRGIK